MPGREPRCLTHRQPQRVCRASQQALGSRCAVSREDYAQMERDHLAFHDLLGTPPDHECGRCCGPVRDCRCYWPEPIESGPPAAQPGASP